MVIRLNNTAGVRLLIHVGSILDQYKQRRVQIYYCYIHSGCESRNLIISRETSQNSRCFPRATGYVALVALAHLAQSLWLENLTVRRSVVDW